MDHLLCLGTHGTHGTQDGGAKCLMAASLQKRSMAHPFNELKRNSGPRPPTTVAFFYSRRMVPAQILVQQASHTRSAALETKKGSGGRFSGTIAVFLQEVEMALTN